MRVAALYDIHGNLPALEAVLAEIPEDATHRRTPYPGAALRTSREEAVAAFTERGL